MNNMTFLCISSRAWDSMKGESQKIMSRISKQNKVLYFEPGRTVNKPIVSEAIRAFPNLFRVTSRKINDNLILIPCPPSLPVLRTFLPRFMLKLWIPVSRVINNFFLARHVKRALKLIPSQNLILWIYSVYQSNLVGQFDETCSVYHNYDEFADFTSNARIKDILLTFENRLVKKVDVVFTTSRPQYEKRKKINPNTYFVPNGVNFELFNQAMDPNLSVPEDIAAISHPIIGFAGMLSTHIDVKLLLQIAEAYPQYSLVLVGPDLLEDSPVLTQLRNLTNVHFLGFKPMESLPNYVRTFDVALIPYILEGHVLSGYPQKLHEYLAAGKAIVASAMPELQPFADYVCIADSADMFIKHIPDAIQDYNARTVQARVQIASKNTWEHRIEEYYRILTEITSK